MIFSEKFQDALKRYHLFTADGFEKLIDYLRIRLLTGDGLEVLQRIEKSKYRPNKKLMDHVGNIINFYSIQNLGLHPKSIKISASSKLETI